MCVNFHLNPSHIAFTSLFTDPEGKQIWRTRRRETTPRNFPDASYCTVLFMNSVEYISGT